MSEQKSPKKTSLADWHRADIVAELRKAGWSLRRLATHHGYSAPTTLVTALGRPWPKGQRLIADAIGVDPADIWPSRYKNNTTPQIRGAQAQQSARQTEPHLQKEMRPNG